MAPYERAVVETITHPTDRGSDPRPGRERYFSEGPGPSQYLCVVIDFASNPGEVVTAFGHRNERQ